MSEPRYVKGQGCAARGQQHDYSIDKGNYVKCSRCGSTRTKPGPREERAPRAATPSKGRLTKDARALLLRVVSEAKEFGEWTWTGGAAPGQGGEEIVTAGDLQELGLIRLTSYDQGRKWSAIPTPEGRERAGRELR